MCIISKFVKGVLLVLPKNRRLFRQQILDLLLRINVATGSAVEVADEVIKKSTSETPMETIRSIMLDSLRERDAPAAVKLEGRFKQIRLILSREDDPRVDLRGEIYDQETADEMLEADEITAAELYFMEGREGRSWQRKRAHRDSTSTHLAADERLDD